MRHIPHNMYHCQVRFANVCVTTLTDGHALKYLQSPRSDRDEKKRFCDENSCRFGTSDGLWSRVPTEHIPRKGENDFTSVSCRYAKERMTVKRPWYLMSRHPTLLLTIKIREEYIPHRQQLGQIKPFCLYQRQVSTLGRVICGKAGQLLVDTKLVEGFLSDEPHASSMYRSNHPPTHPS